MTVRRQQFGSGALFIAIGLATFWFSIEFEMWDGRRVGSGLFPAGLGLILVGIGVVVFIQGVFTADTQAGSRGWNVRPILALCIALFAYALLVERAGNLVALAAAGLIAIFADRPNFKYFAIVYVIVVAFVYFFLIGTIKLPYKLI